MNGFYCPTRIYAGTGAAQVLRELDCGKVFLVADPYFVESGTAGKLLKEAGVKESQIFSRITPDPSVELAAAGTAAVRAFAPDTVVALGGGSAMDCAKAMVFFADMPVKLVAIPTTSGSGSEVTDFAILTHGNVKHPLVDARLQPDVAILDDALLTKLPASLIADTGFDVLAHALEAWTATGSSCFSDALAQEAFCIVLKALESSYRGDISVRLRLHQASTMAGMAFSQAGLGLCHALSHVLGGAFHVPHGRLNAVLLPAVIQFNTPAAGSKYAVLSRAANLGGAADAMAVRNLKNSLLSLRRAVGLPENLRQAGIDPAALAQQREVLAAKVLEDPCCAANPVVPNARQVCRILEEVSGYGR